MQNLDLKIPHRRTAAACLALLTVAFVVGCEDATLRLLLDVDLPEPVAGVIISPDVTNDPTDSGSEAPLPAIEPSVNIGTSGQGSVTEEIDGATITLSASPTSGWSFSNWLGAVAEESRGDNPLVIITTATTFFPIHLTAVFVLGEDDELGVAEVAPSDDDSDDTLDDSDIVDDGDDDGDGVDNDVDRCADTPAGTIVDRTGCPVSVGGGGGGGGGGGVDGGDVGNCGDGTVDVGEDCDDGNRTNGDGCDSNCITETCGNSVVQAGEQCDPPLAGICDDNCQLIASGDNDSCSTPTVVGIGETSFSNVDATSDGPMEGLTCLGFDTDSDFADIWFIHTTTCTGFLTVSLCASDVVYDTTLAVYEGFECPTLAPIVCSDDDCGFGVASRVSFAVVEGAELLIRIGGFENTPPEFVFRGNGTLNISCGDSPGGTDSCGEVDAGDCFATNGSAGCAEQTCCETVCADDPFCCEVDWDAFCSGSAAGLCESGTGFTACGAGAGDCFTAGDSPGCGDEDCCQSVCEQDTFCCLDTWDDVCASAARSCSR